MWSAKYVNKIFPSQRNKNQNFWTPDGKFWSPIFLLRIRTKRMPLGPQRRFFCQKIRLNTNTLIIYTPTCTTKKTRRTNHASHKLCFVRLPNVSSQLCTLSYLYLLKKKCTRRKNCRLVLCSMSKTIFLLCSVKTIEGSPCFSHQATTVQHLSFKCLNLC